MTDGEPAVPYAPEADHLLWQLCFQGMSTKGRREGMPYLPPCLTLLEPFCSRLQPARVVELVSRHHQHRRNFPAITEKRRHIVYGNEVQDSSIHCNYNTHHFLGLDVTFCGF